MSQPKTALPFRAVLRKLLNNSIRACVRPSVGRSVGLSVRRSVMRLWYFRFSALFLFLIAEVITWSRCGAIHSSSLRRKTIRETSANENTCDHVIK